MDLKSIKQEVEDHMDVEETTRAIVPDLRPVGLYRNINSASAERAIGRIRNAPAARKSCNPTAPDETHNRIGNITSIGPPIATSFKKLTKIVEDVRLPTANKSVTGNNVIFANANNGERVYNVARSGNIKIVSPVALHVSSANLQIPTIDETCLLQKRTWRRQNTSSDRKVVAVGKTQAPSPPSSNNQTKTSFPGSNNEMPCTVGMDSDIIKGFNLVPISGNSCNIGTSTGPTPGRTPLVNFPTPAQNTILIVPGSSGETAGFAPGLGNSGSTTPAVPVSSTSSSAPDHTLSSSNNSIILIPPSGFMITNENLPAVAPEGSANNDNKPETSFTSIDSINATAAPTNPGEFLNSSSIDGNVGVKATSEKKENITKKNVQQLLPKQTGSPCTSTQNTAHTANKPEHMPKTVARTSSVDGNVGVKASSEKKENTTKKNVQQLLPKQTGSPCTSTQNTAHPTNKTEHMPKTVGSSSTRHISRNVVVMPRLSGKKSCKPSTDKDNVISSVGAIAGLPTTALGNHPPADSYTKHSPITILPHGNGSFVQPRPMLSVSSTSPSTKTSNSSGVHAETNPSSLTSINPGLAGKRFVIVPSVTTSQTMPPNTLSTLGKPVSRVVLISPSTGNLKAAKSDSLCSVSSSVTGSIVSSHYTASHNSENKTDCSKNNTNSTQSKVGLNLFPDGNQVKTKPAENQSKPKLSSHLNSGIAAVVSTPRKNMVLVKQANNINIAEDGPYSTRNETVVLPLSTDRSKETSKFNPANAETMKGKSNSNPSDADKNKGTSISEGPSADKNKGRPSSCRLNTDMKKGTFSSCPPNAYTMTGTSSSTPASLESISTAKKIGDSYSGTISLASVTPFTVSYDLRDQSSNPHGGDVDEQIAKNFTAIGGISSVSKGESPIKDGNNHHISDISSSVGTKLVAIKASEKGPSADIVQCINTSAATVKCITTSADQVKRAAISAETVKHAATSANIVKHAATSANIVKRAATSADTVKHAATSANIVKHSATSAKIVKRAATSADTVKHAATSANIVKHAATSAKIVKRAATSADTVKHAATSANIVKHAATSAKIVKRAATSADTVKHAATSANIVKHAATSAKIVKRAATSADTVKHAATSANIVKHAATSAKIVKRAATSADTVKHAATSVDTVKCATTSVDTVKCATTTVDTVERATTSAHTVNHTTTSADTLRYVSASVNTLKRDLRTTDEGVTKRLKSCTTQSYKRGVIKGGRPVREEGAKDKPLDVAKSPRQRMQLKKIYSCQICCKRFRLKAQYCGHLMLHCNRLYLCGVCNISWFCLQRLTEHLRTVHHVDTGLKCFGCRRFYPDRRSLRKHRGLHTVAEFHSCETCGKKFKTRKRLLEHMEGHKEKQCANSLPLSDQSFSRKLEEQEPGNTPNVDNLSLCKKCLTVFSYPGKDDSQHQCSGFL